MRPESLALLLLAAAFLYPAGAQSTRQAPDSAEMRAIPNHVPAWASPEHFVAAVPEDEKLEALTLVLARHADRQQAFDKLLADQQDPNSPEYHHWLTPSQIGERYGLTAEELNSLTDWLVSQGLHVDWVAPGRNFIGFSGSAGDVGRAFQADLNYYDVEGERKLSVASDPIVPAALTAKIKAIRGLYTIEDKPLHRMRVVRSDSPEMTLSNGDHSITPGDFATIYDTWYFATIYDTWSGFIETGTRIGIVGRSRVDYADFQNFNDRIGVDLVPKEIIPTKFGGVDPGPPFTSPPSDGASIGDQAEATLDVLRAGTVGQGAGLMLVAATAKSGGIEVDAQYLVQTEPVPAKIMTISFGECESKAGRAGVDYWDSLFQQAAGEGISVFVASGDAGASGCDENFSLPPSHPLPNSPNYICSSSYATCVGGTGFNDLKNPNLYWSPYAGWVLQSALSYIPEGAWNEPLNRATPPGPQAASSGGGVSKFIPTPIWQVGKGVPAARAGRYTPDLAFASSQHDGYFGCLAAAGGSCAIQNGSIAFISFSGTSAAAPDMAGIAALLEGRLGPALGNINPALYSLATSHPKVFHDVTPASSGVDPCIANIPSMCNNSIPGPSGLAGGQAGFEVTPGYDEATGLGSLDVTKFIYAYTDLLAPTVTTGPAIDVKEEKATLTGTVHPNGLITECFFTYATNSSLMNAKGTRQVNYSGSETTVPVSAIISGLSPGTKYYYTLWANNQGGGVDGKFAHFVTEKLGQTINFKQPAGPIDYGTHPIELEANASSRLPVKLTLLSGHATLSGSTLTINGPGHIAVAADQAGNGTYLPAAEIRRTITVSPAVLKVSAKNEGMAQGGQVPELAYAISGFVNGDTRATAVRGTPTLATTANSSSQAGTYPITVKMGSLWAAKYTFQLVGGTLTVMP